MLFIRNAALHFESWGHNAKHESDEVIILTYVIVELRCIYLHIRDYFRFADSHALAAQLLDAFHASNATPRPLTEQQVYHKHKECNKD